MSAPVLLLPPSEGKAPGGRGAAQSTRPGRFDALQPTRDLIAEALITAIAGGEASNAKLLGVKGVALEAATGANRDVLTAPTMAAISRYSGVLYEALDFSGLDASARRRGHQQVVIFSGLWGLVAPLDPIPDYKLKMGAALPGLGKLSTLWRPHVPAALEPIVRRRTVWDLLPNEHSAAWAPDPAAYRQRIRVKFVDDVPDGRGRKRVTVAHWNKLLKGALVRHVLETTLDDPDGLRHFQHPEGYVYDPALTVTRDREVEVTLVAVKG